MKLIVIVILAVMLAGMLISLFFKLVGFAIVVALVGVAALWVARKLKGSKDVERLPR